MKGTDHRQNSRPMALTRHSTLLANGFPALLMTPVKNLGKCSEQTPVKTGQVQRTEFHGVGSMTGGGLLVTFHRSVNLEVVEWRDIMTNRRDMFSSRAVVAHMEVLLSQHLFGLADEQQRKSQNSRYSKEIDITNLSQDRYLCANPVVKIK
jgi:hypothetical protein